MLINFLALRFLWLIIFFSKFKIFFLEPILLLFIFMIKMFLAFQNILRLNILLDLILFLIYILLLILVLLLSLSFIFKIHLLLNFHSFFLLFYYWIIYNIHYKWICMLFKELGLAILSIFIMINLLLLYFLVLFIILWNFVLLKVLLIEHILFLYSSACCWLVKFNL